MKVVVLDFATFSLIAQSVNRAGIAQQASHVVDIVPVDMVVVHGRFFRGPAIAHRNTDIVRIGYFVMFDNGVPRVTSTDSGSTLMFVGHAGNQVVLDCITGTDFILVRGVVRNMDFGG